MSKECNEVELESWKDVLLKWATCKSPPARQLAILVKEGIPEALRGEVWFRLAKADLDPKLMDTYRVLITKVINKNIVIISKFSFYICSFSKINNFISTVL